MCEATKHLKSQLHKSVPSKTEGSWRYSKRSHKPLAECTFLPSGSIDLSPAKYPQGHDVGIDIFCL